MKLIDQYNANNWQKISGFATLRFTEKLTHDSSSAIQSCENRFSRCQSRRFHGIPKARAFDWKLSNDAMETLWMTTKRFLIGYMHDHLVTDVILWLCWVNSLRKWNITYAESKWVTSARLKSSPAGRRYYDIFRLLACVKSVPVTADWRLYMSVWNVRDRTWWKINKAKSFCSWLTDIRYMSCLNHVIISSMG